MNPERWQLIDGIFLEAVEQPPEQRAEFVRKACGADASLRAEVESLLANDQQASVRLARVVGEAASTTAEPEQAPMEAGRRVGPYRVVRPIASGGMGSVFLAVRDDDHFRQQVALKVIAAGMGSEAIVQRFRHERQILAALEHPNIARLLDGGATPEGHPYFVMEYIEGQPITTHCRERGLSIRDRLELFRLVCGAVQYAHQNLVIHRDLKPGNILVSADGTPKLLDFGIAKVLDQGMLEGGPSQTVTGLQMLTPEYASPEQVRGQAITTASDVYSLGVVLFELLTGEKAHRFQLLTPIEIERAVCEAETEKPSTVVGRTSQQTHSPRRLARELAGDLDTIVLTAMQKDPQRRYVSVAALSEDIRRLLEGLPIQARKDTVRYRTWKFVRRNRVVVGLTSVIMASLIGGIIAATYQARRAERRFQDVRKLANSFFFEIDGMLRDIPGTTRAREAMVKNALTYLDSLAAEANDRELMRELSSAYMRVAEVQGNPYRPNLGQIEGARRSAEKGVDLIRREHQRDPADKEGQRLLATAYFQLADLQKQQGERAADANSLELGLALAEPLYSRNPADSNIAGLLLSGYNRMGDRRLENGRLAEAGDAYRKALAVAEHQHSLTVDDRTRSMLAMEYSRLANVQVDLGDLGNAVTNFEKAVEVRQKRMRTAAGQARNEVDLTNLYNVLGDVSGNPDAPNLRQPEKSRVYYERALEIVEKRVAADSNNVLDQIVLIESYLRIGARALHSTAREADAWILKAHARASLLTAQFPKNLTLRMLLALAVREIGLSARARGDRATARTKLEEALKILEGLRREDAGSNMYSSYEIADQISLGDVAREDGRWEDALAWYRKAQPNIEALVAGNSASGGFRMRLADLYGSLGRLWQARASREQARDWHMKAAQVWTDWEKAGTPNPYAAYRRGEALQEASLSK